MKQLSFELPEINRDETKKAVEAAFEKYRFYLLTVPDEKLPKITATYSLVPPTNTNEFHSSTEDIVIKTVDFERERDNYVEWIRRAVNRLSIKERELIIKRYLQDEEVFDYEIYNELSYSERRYYRLKARIFYKLAFLLKIEVYNK
ncbi:ArpU family phage packaging/lysis transcriptional regulator [Niallia taxi]|uniref:ArpU family phage packaging/lysis transcriptional regulator n=1 Tax=Niallia taxi TaxID=2499688 RepID=UPI002E20B94E|nr:ArpU family phage packaging/lysis transcriptional regulator [Niallia taxi]MED4052953.1 ArpU family phage packaging/lysis transcriptional regulator [Niallia taxi]MED4118093.1 ArpU family phage packaging/lysis transcriptional regulator [Niallia taxi]